MATREIVKQGEEVLRAKCKPITVIDKRIHTLLDDMAATMYEVDGAGLAANQVGVRRRVVVIDVGDGLIELINPELLETSGEQVGMEGCLSCPGVRGYVARPETVKAKALDRFGKAFEITGSGMLARALCHETDHLDGKMFVELILTDEQLIEKGYDPEELRNANRRGADSEAENDSGGGEA